MSVRYEINIQLVNDVSALEQLSVAVENFAERIELSPGESFKLNLVLDELVTNITDYAFVDDGLHGIFVTLWHEGEWYGAEVRDQGLAFNPLDVPPPDLESPVEERHIGGLGVHFLREMMDAYDYRRSDGWNCLAFKKKQLPHCH